MEDKIHKASVDFAEGERGRELVRLTSVCVESLSGAWRLVRGRILSTLNWAGQGQAVWEKEWGVSLKMRVWKGGRWRGCGS